MNTIKNQQRISSAVFLGSKKLGLAIIKSLIGISPEIKWTIIHPDDSDDPRSNLKDFQTFAKLQKLDLKIVPSSAATKQLLFDIKPDIGIVSGWYTLLDYTTLSYVKKGLWGIHNSLLPKYRGCSPLVWSIINGDLSVGCSVFRISEGMDDGEIAHQVIVDNTSDDDIHSILNKIESKLILELPSVWQTLLFGEGSFISQFESEATYCGQRVACDGLIDWRQPAEYIHNFIKAQSRPYPCAFSYLNGEKVLFLKSRSNELQYFGTPGQVLKRNLDSVLVSCGNNTAIEILRIEVNNKEVNVVDMFRSIKDRLTSA